MRTLNHARRLSPRQQVFVSEYLKHGNGAAAARAAGYSESYADKSIAALLNRPAIAAAIAEHRAKLVERTDFDLAAAVDEIDELMREARAAKQYTAASSLFT